MRKIGLLLLLVMFVLPMMLFAQENNAPFTSVEEFQSALDEVLNTSDATERASRLDALWNRLIENNQIPLTIGTTAIFLYRGEAEHVEWRGDFTNWERRQRAVGQRQGETDLWMMTQEFPADARFDYKIVLNRDEWILDPNNPYQQMGGFGPNSELRMPEFEPSPYVEFREDIEHGTLTDDQTIASVRLGYSVNFRVYRPAQYDELDDLPVVYVTDGQDYANDAMGSMVIVLDNLIAEGLIEPVMAVFIDPRDPDDSTFNRRESELITNDAYAAFIATELVPLIDVLYDTNPTPDARVIFGMSLGGLNAAFVGFNYDDVFGMVAINSPAFWVDTSIYYEYENTDRLPLNIFMTTGCPWDTCEDARQMREILELQGYPLHYIEVNDGHSWGNWRRLVDDMLIYFFGVA